MTEVREAPRCRTHPQRPMVRRNMTGATYEQKFCGEWWDCPEPGCHASVLFESPELQAQLREMNRPVMREAAELLKLARAASTGRGGAKRAWWQLLETARRVYPVEHGRAAYETAYQTAYRIVQQIDDSGQYNGTADLFNKAIQLAEGQASP